MSHGLSARQEECLRLTAFLTDKEIAVRLGLAEATVKKHVHEACRRLGVNRRKAALALLERNVPEATKDPMAAEPSLGVSRSAVTEFDDVSTNQDVAPLDVGRPRSSAGRIQPAGTERPGQGASAARTGGRRGAGEPPGTSAAGAERGLGDGPGGRPERRLGYRPPPRGLGFRLLIIVLSVVLTAVMMKAVADMVAAYTSQADVIYDNTSARAQQPG